MAEAELAAGARPDPSQGYRDLSQGYRWRDPARLTPHGEFVELMGQIPAAVRSIFPGGENRALAEDVLGLGTLGAAGVSAIGPRIQKLVEFLARQKGRIHPSMQEDLKQEGLLRVWQRLQSSKPIPEERETSILGANARGAMDRYISRNAGAYREPEEARRLRRHVEREEWKWYTRTGQSPTDEELAGMTNLPARRVSLLRAERGSEGAVPLNTVTGELESPVRSRLIKKGHRQDVTEPVSPGVARSEAYMGEPEEIIGKVPAQGPASIEGATPAFDPMSLAKTDKQRRILELYLQGQSTRDIERATGVKHPNVTAFLKKLKERGFKGLPPISGGSEGHGLSLVELDAYANNYRRFVNRGGPDKEPDPNIVRQLRAPQMQAPLSETWVDMSDDDYRRVSRGRPEVNRALTEAGLRRRSPTEEAFAYPGMPTMIPYSPLERS